jgi:hypothetical protein
MESSYGLEIRRLEMDEKKFRTESATKHCDWLYEAASSVNLGEWVLESRALGELLLLIADELADKDLKIAEYQEEFDRMFQQSQRDLVDTIMVAFKVSAEKKGD